MPSNKYKSTFRNAQPSARVPPGQYLKHEWVPMLEGWSFCKHCGCRMLQENTRFSQYINFVEITYYTPDGVKVPESWRRMPGCRLVPKPSPRKGFRT